MRLADVEVLSKEEGVSIPPIELRLDLQPGDRVGLLEEVRHPGLGEGLSPIEAVVLGSPEPGWFIGETEDGREIEFHADQVADIELGSPSMGGIFDWAKRLFQKPAPPPVPGVIQLPSGLPAPLKPEVRKGLISQLKTFLKVPLIARKEAEGPRTQATGIFDVFKQAPAPPGLPAERGERGVTPAETRPSVVSVFEAREKVVIPFVEKLTEPMKVFTAEHKVVIPFLEAITAPAQVFPKSPELEPFEVREAKQMELFAKMFPEAPEAPPPKPTKEVFSVFSEEEIQPYGEVIPPSVPKRLHRDMKVLPLPRRTTLLPTVDDVIRGLVTFYNPIEDVFDLIRGEKGSPAWNQVLKEEGVVKFGFETLGTCGGPPSYFEELASFLHVPWEEFRKRAVIEEVEERGETYEEWADDEKIWMEIIFPASEILTEAMNLLKPEDLPGRFIMDWNDDHKCMLVLSYEESRKKGEAPPAEVDPRELMTSLEDQLFASRMQLEDLDPNVEGYREIRQELENEMQAIRNEIASIEETIGELEEELKPEKRTPEKKKGRKRKKGRS